MEFRIAQTFTDSLAKLRGDEQKAAKMTAFDLQMDPASPGMKFHRIDRSRDPNFWSVRINRDLRLIVHKSKSSFLLCYVDHHDDAYKWAERRKLETHPKTGAAQWVEIPETVHEMTIHPYVAYDHVSDQRSGSRAIKPVLAGIDEDQLSRYGVPEEWLKEVLAADEDQLLDIASHLPAEASEAVLAFAIGETPDLPQSYLSASEDPFAHPDAMRRFRTVQDSDELRQALEYPWEKWLLFLHPAQRKIVEKNYKGPARVSGSAGTGKTIVALHRTVHLLRSNPDSRVLLTTFSDTLANALQTKLACLIGDQPRLGERAEVASLNGIADRLYRLHFGPAKVAQVDTVAGYLVDIAKKQGAQFGERLLFGEWDQIVDAWQLKTWEEYRDAKRAGRRTRLAEGKRQELWKVFEQLRERLENEGLITRPQLFASLTEKLVALGRPPFDSAIVDEAQDISVAQLRFLAALAGNSPNGLFFAGDLGQRIFQTPFSWSSVGINVRGRSRILKVNYRTSHQIRSQADQLLDPEVSDVDGNRESRLGTVSVFNGPRPQIQSFVDEQDEITAVAEWIRQHQRDGLKPQEVGVFVRSEEELHRATAAVDTAGLPFRILDDSLDTRRGEVSVSTMHLAKGLEFRAVVVMACDDEVIPSQSRIESVSDQLELEEVYETERHLLYVACTRARDQLLVTGMDPISEFLDDLGGT